MNYKFWLAFGVGMVSVVIALMWNFSFFSLVTAINASNPNQNFDFVLANVRIFTDSNSSTFNYTVTSVSPADSKHVSKEWEAFHKSTMEQITCEQPYPKVIEVMKLFADPTMTLIPQCAVLHICDADTGCCPNGYRCAAVAQETANFTFRTLSIGGVSHPPFLNITFLNHTRCGCIKN